MTFSTLPKLKDQKRKYSQVLVEQEISYWESMLSWKVPPFFDQRKILGRYRHHLGIALL